MRSRSIIFGLIATTAACGSGSLGTGGTAGTSATGTGGVAGTTGVGGFVAGDAGAGWIDTAGTTGGAGTGGGIAGSGGAGTGGGIAGSGGAGTGGASSLPTCGGSGGGSSDVVELAVVAPDGMVASDMAATAVRVTAADSCSTVTCPTTVGTSGNSVYVSVSAMATRFLLTASDNRTWTVYLRNSAMPGDLIKVDDTFDMTVQGGVNSFFYKSISQTLILAHGSDLVVFASVLTSFSYPPLPLLDAFGIAVTDAGARCEGPTTVGCINRPHTVHVTVGTDGADVASGTAAVGWLSFTNAAYMELHDTGNCDSKDYSQMAGFRTP